MKSLSPILLSLPGLALLVHASSLRAEEPVAYRPALFEKTRLVYEDDFEDGEIDLDFWEIRQHSTWEIQEGVLSGSQSSKAFQEKMREKGDLAHAGFKPVIWLKQVPENFVCTMRVRYDAEDYIPRFPLIDVGHHIHTLTFSKDRTTLTLRKDVATVPVEAPLFSLNEWHEVAIELKKGILLLVIDGKKHRFEHPEIDMAGQAQIDFKGINFGTCRIDDLKLWEGL